MTTEKKQNEPEIKLAKEIDLIKATFKDNDSLLKLLRKVFFGFELSQSEKEIVRTSFANADLRYAIRRRSFGSLSEDIERDLPLGWEADFWMGTAKQIVAQHQDTIRQLVDAKRIAKDDFYEKAFALMENPDGPQVDFSYNPDSLIHDPMQSRLIARDIYFSSVTTVLAAIRTIAEAKDVSPQEKKDNEAKDSMK